MIRIYQFYQSHMHYRVFITTLVGLAALLASCNKSSTFGGDILDDFTLNSIFTDSVQVEMTLLNEDSLNTSDPNSISDYLLCGRLEDPILGVSEATIYTGLQLSALKNDFVNTKLDSVVLYLGVVPSSVYGDTSKLHEFEVTLLENHPSRGTTYYSDDQIPVSTAPQAVVGRGSWLPKPNVAAPIIDSTSAVRDSASGTWFSIKLDNSFGERILKMDSTQLNNDTLFWAAIPGLQIKSKTSGAVFGLNLNDRTFNRITLYYKKDTANAQQRVANVQFIGENKFSNYSTSPSNFVTSRLDKTLQDDLMPIQGLAGTRIAVNIPYITDAKKQKWAINTADLIFHTASTIPNDNLMSFPPASQLTAIVSVGDTAYAAVADVIYSLNSTGDSYALFGGKPVGITENGVQLTRYKLALPSHVQDMISAKQTKKFYIILAPLTRTAQRVILHSPGTTSPYRSKLNLRYTIVE